MRRAISLAAAAVLLLLTLTGCGQVMEVPSNAPSSITEVADPEEGRDTAGYLRLIMDTPETLDPQARGAAELLSVNVFDRIVEIQENADGTSEIVPSVAKSWMVSGNGTIYQFALNDTVRFHNGESLTAEDIRFSYERLLTSENSAAPELLKGIEGAEELQQGEEKHLSGFEILDDYSIRITLSEPDGSFLARLANPAASLLNRKTVKQAGKDFGLLQDKTPGTGYFRFDGWDYCSKMLLSASAECWKGQAACEGLVLMDVDDEENSRELFESGKLDILDLDRIYSQQESFMKEEGMAEQIVRAPREEIHFIVLNGSDEVLKDPEVRKALLLGTDRQALLDALYNGDGTVLNGILPSGVLGYDPELKEIPYDPEQAKEILEERESEETPEIRLCCPQSANDTEKELYKLLKEQWSELGIRVAVENLTLEEFGEKRAEGTLMAFRGTFAGTINDPSTYFEPFFGSLENSEQYGLNYDNGTVIARVEKARRISDDEERLEEYRELEKTIVQDEAAWIPLYSREHLYAVNAAVSNFTPSWMGEGMNDYHKVTVNRERT